MKNIVLTIAAILVFAAAAFAQGSIAGTITDAKGNGVANVKVAVVGADGKAIATVQTDQDGAYTFDEIAAGKYKVAAYGAKGYAAAFRNDVVVTDDEATTLNITLSIQSSVTKPPIKPAAPPAITLDEIISKHIDALGGREKLLSLKTVRATGTLIVQGTDVPVTNTISHLIGSRSDFSPPGLSPGYRIVTPTKGTIFDYIGFSGKQDFQNMDAEELKRAQTGLDIQGPFLDYRAKGNSAELLGTEKVDGEDNFKLKVTFKSGGFTTCYISSKTYLITKVVGKVTIGGEPTDIETRYSNYKKNADGYVFAYTIATAVGETNYDKIETNIAVDPAIFALPN